MDSFGRYVEDSVTNQLMREKELLEATEILARDRRPGQKTAKIMFILIDGSRKKVKIGIDSEVLIYIKCIERKVRMRIGTEERMYWEKSQEGDEIMVRDVMTNMLKFLTTNVKFRNILIRSNCEVIQPTWDHIQSLEFITSRIIFYKTGICFIRDRIYTRWMQFFQHGYDRPLLISFRRDGEAESAASAQIRRHYPFFPDFVTLEYFPP